MILFVWGQDKTPNSSIKNGIWVTDSLMYQVGFRNGDKVVAVGDEPVQYFEEISKKILFSNGKTITVERDGNKVSIDCTKWNACHTTVRNLLCNLLLVLR